MSRSNRRNSEPTHVSSVIALAFAVIATGLSVPAPNQLLPISVEVVGLLILMGGKTLRQREHRITGGGLLFVGICLVWLSLGLAAVFPVNLFRRAMLFLGMTGTAILAVGLAPLRTAWSRYLLIIGIGTIIASILGSGVANQTPQFHIVGAVAAGVLAWDAGEQAINLGEYPGTDASTFVVEVTHIAGSGVVGIVALLASMGVYGFTVSKIPLMGLVLLLASAAIFFIYISMDIM